MASSVGAGRTRAVLWAVFGILVLVFLIDGGSSAIARAQVDEDAKTAGRVAVQQISGQPVNQETAKVAYAAAVEALPNSKEHIVANGPGDAEDFTVHPDGSITMTVTRQAPTLLFKYLPKLQDFAVAKTTYTQAQLIS